MSDKDGGPALSADAEFTGDNLKSLVIDIEAAIGSHRAGLTPLGRTVTALCEDTYRAMLAERNKAHKG